MRLALIAPFAIVIQTLAQAPLPAVGDPAPDFVFDGLVGHDGRTRLAQLIGHPVLLAGWRAHLVDGIHAARVATQAYEAHEKDGLVIIMQYRELWRGDDAWVGPASFWQIVTGFVPWIHPSHPSAKDRQLPIARSTPNDDVSLVLIGTDGTILAEGSAESIRDKEKRSDFRTKVKRLVAAEIKKRKQGWGDDKVAVQARALAFGKDQLAKAIETLDAPEEDAPERGVARHQIETHYAGRLESVRFYVSQARYGDALAAIKALRKAVRGHDQWSNEVDRLAAELDTPEMKRLISLEKKLLKIVAPVTAKRPKASVDLLGDLYLFADEHGDNPVGERAAREAPFFKSVASSILGVRYPELDAKLEKYLSKRQKRR